MRLATIPAAVLVAGGLLAPASAGDGTGFAYTTFDVPGIPPGGYQVALKINDRGQIVGYFQNSTGTHGFLYDRGVVTTLDAPGTLGRGIFAATFAFGINDRGQIAGTFIGVDGNFHEFIESRGTFTTIDAPGSTHTEFRAINDLGEALGCCVNGGPWFVYAYGHFTPVSLPYTGWGINNFEQIVGYFDDNTGEHGFLDDQGVVTIIDAPGALASGSPTTDAYGINDRGQIAGLYFDANFNLDGFVDNRGTFTTLVVPGAFGTQAFGINNRGQIVGQYFDNIIFAPHNFVATPDPGASDLPEPAR